VRFWPETADSEVGRYDRSDVNLRLVAMVNPCKTAALVAGLLIPAAMVIAQESSPAPEADRPAVAPLAAKQEMIRERLRRLEDVMFRLRRDLQATEPESAARLAKALQDLGQVGLEQKIDALVQLLADQTRLSRAGDLQGEVVEELNAVLAALLARRDPEAARLRAEELRRQQQDVQVLLDEQRALRTETADASAAERRARRLAEAVQRVEQLIDRQKELKEGAREEPSGAPAAAASQARLADQARQLAGDVKAIDPPSDAAGQQDAESPAAQAAEAIQKAAGEMDAAAQAMKGQAEPSQPESESGSGSTPRSPAEEVQEKQAQALEQLERARHVLQEETKRASAQEAAPQADSAAARQRGAAQKAGELSERMKGGQPGSNQDTPGQPGGQQGQQQGTQQPSPGQQNVEQARSHMDRAADDLRDDQPEQALPDQDAAAEELQEALNKLEDELQQLRREERQELLGDLEARFAAMLSRQLAVNAETITLHQRSTGDLSRADRLRAAELSTEQSSLAQEAATCLHILDEDGTTIVFPGVVEQLQQDMEAAAQRLADAQVGPLTQAVQDEIAATLRELVEAVRQLREQESSNPSEPGEPSSDPNQQQPLLPGSAELKLLRASQQRINDRTSAIEQARQSGQETAESLRRALEQLEQRQRTVADAARAMRDEGE